MSTKQHFHQLNKKYITLKEWEKQFTPEEKKEIAAEVRRYKFLMRLRKLRKKAKLTQAQLATKANLPRTTITKIESGEYNPTVNTLMTIASAMHKELEINFV